jgi:hypothetical protein
MTAIGSIDQLGRRAAENETLRAERRVMVKEHLS